MRALYLLIGTAGLLAMATAVSAKDWDFEDVTAGKLPEGWTAAKTGTGPGSEWEVIEDRTAPKGPKVLAQVSSEGPKPLFNLCVDDKSSYKDLDLSVSFKAVRGKIDQGGGPVWRYQDANNYYVCRMNPLEVNFRLYKVVDGKRKKLATADVPLGDDEEPEDLTGKWHTIRVVQVDNRIRCYLNGKLLLGTKDDSLKKAGKVGLWTKADAVTSFDNLTVRAPK